MIGDSTMRKKLKTCFQIFALALLPAFVMRPVIVTVNYGSFHSANSQETKAFSTNCQAFSASHLAFRSVDREAPDVTILVPRISKVKAPSLLENPINVVFASAVSSPKSFLVLRI